jgi:ABC-type lipoprotein export system ATPase subunit
MILNSPPSARPSTRAATTSTGRSTASTWTSRRKKVTALRGPSGSGKTTLLTIVGCLARPTEGRVRLDGEDISGLPERFLTEIRRRRFGFVFQQFNLIKGLSALDNIILPAYPTGQPRKELLERAEELLAGSSSATAARPRWNGSPAASSSASPSAAP